MENKNIIYNYLVKNNYILNNNNSNGIDVVFNNKEVIIRGTKLDLIELADVIITVALSDDIGSHVHIDDLTLLNINSDIKSLIIENNNR